MIEPTREELIEACENLIEGCAPLIGEHPIPEYTVAVALRSILTKSADYVLVPSNPTVGQYGAFCLARPIDESPTNWNGFIVRYKAMLAASREGKV